MHVRIGRRKQVFPKYGEQELCRVLQRWDRIELPPLSNILHTLLSLEVENGPPFELQVFLYEVKKDWNPGEGGILYDNTSPPQKGEVWWGDVAYKEEAWGLPGAGFASDENPGADTPAMPLAEARYHPEIKKLEFTSPELTSYIGERVRSHKPLLFLLKLSDYQEDIPGSRLSFYSADYGTDWDIEKRPRLLIEWESPAEFRNLKEEVFVEYGRTYVLPRIACEGATYCSLSFIPNDGYENPTIYLRGVGAGNISPWTGGISPWRRYSSPFAIDLQWIDIKLNAVTNPVILGQPFKAELRDTWVVKKPPEQQEVLWDFHSPTNLDYQVKAEYQNNYLWKVHFNPTELGRWRYSWKFNFDGYQRSSQGIFDVVGGDRSNIKKQLEALLKEIKNSKIKTSIGRMKHFEVPFTRLERAAFQLETPESFTSESGYKLRKLIDELRLPLAGKPIPEVILMHAFPRKWRGNNH
jgi:hypothetical protein